MPEQPRQKLQLIWRPRAQKQWDRILVFYTNRNQSLAYSLELDERLRELLDILRMEHFESGEQTSRKNIRRISFEKFAVFFRITKDYLEVTSIVDARRNVPLN